jgi:hypothetical protein
MRSTKGEHAAGEAEKSAVPFWADPVMPVRFVVLAVGVQGNAVVAAEKVDATLRAFAGPGIDVGTATDAGGKETEHPIIAAPETSHIIAVPSVPLRLAAL